MSAERSDRRLITGREISGSRWYELYRTGGGFYTVSSRGEVSRGRTPHSSPIGRLVDFVYDYPVGVFDGCPRNGFNEVFVPTSRLQEFATGTYYKECSHLVIKPQFAKGKSRGLRVLTPVCLERV